MTRRRVFLLLLVSSFGQRLQVVAQEGDNKTSEWTLVPGCLVCGDYRCPDDTARCPLGVLPDPCECCPGGVCARIDGQSCWNETIKELHPRSRNEGFCARNYRCQLRVDLKQHDEPEAICVCMEQSPACGSNNETYTTPCALHEQAMRIRNSTLKLQHLGPCPSRPWIPSPPTDVTQFAGHRVALSCEVKGFPVPDVIWEFHSADGRTVLKLPSDEHEGTVNSSDGPEPLMRTSWMQLVQLGSQHVGTYHCIASNTNGEAIVMASVFMK